MTESPSSDRRPANLASRQSIAIALVLLVGGMLLLPAGDVLAQNKALNRGSLLTIGGLWFRTSSGELNEAENGESRTNTIRWNQTFGGFLGHGLAFSGAVEYLRSSANGQSYYRLSTGPEVTMFIDTGSKTLPFVTGGFRVLGTSTEGANTGVGFNLGGGLAYFTSRYLALGANATYLYENIKFEGATRASSGSTFVIGLSAIGFIY